MSKRCSIILALAACEGGQSPAEPDPDPQSRTTGLFCIDASITGLPGDQVYEVDQPVHVRFNITECLSSSCTENASASCLITAANGEFVVAAEASWLDTSAGGQGCTDDCGQLGALCSTPPLPEGTHRFAFGADFIELQIPSTLAAAPCVMND